jgi:hypothetical protein
MKELCRLSLAVTAFLLVETHLPVDADQSCVVKLVERQSAERCMALIRGFAVERQPR